MLRFQTILWIFYFVVAFFSYFYLRKSYFAQFPTTMEKTASTLMALFWIVSVPVTWILRQDAGEDMPDMATSYDGFVGREQ